jgi:2-amino-4-hydroxy-6-hydroxymethyldihydropteridine diphosphokinase
LLLGSNVGKKAQNLKIAKNLIEQEAGHLIRLSSVYRTEPWGNSSQDLFYNQVLLVETDLLPSSLLEKILSIEMQMGRIRDQKWGPRLIDIDILDYNGQIIQNSELIVPHPFMHERMFTLIPLKEIASEWKHPVFHKTVSQLIQECKDTNKVETVEA